MASSRRSSAAKPLPKRILICGPRTWKRPFWVFCVVAGLKRKYGDDIVIINGLAKGVDTMADDACYRLDLEPDRYPVDWSRGAISANLRNREMHRVGKPDLVVAIGFGYGTLDMVTVARNGGTPVLWRYIDYTE